MTITNPPVGETVNELTPPIAWTFSGTQRAAGIRVWEIDENGARELLYERRRHRTDDTSITLPMNVLKSGRDYRVEVTVTDGIDRQGMTRDERVASAERDFTYVRGGVTAVSALTATGNGPGVTLAWTRAGTAPDYFALKVDDEEVDDYQRIDPTEVGSSPSFSMDYWGVRPGILHTYEIEAVVLTTGALKHSSGNATTTYRSTQYGIYLMKDDETTPVFIADQEEAGVVIDENATTYMLANGRDQVRVTQSVKGYRGTCAGRVLSEDDRDRLLNYKGRLDRFRLIFADYSLWVRMEELEISPDPAFEDIYRVSFGWFQDAKYDFHVTGGGR